MEIVSCEADLAASQKLIESAICLVSRSLSALQEDFGLGSNDLFSPNVYVARVRSRNRGYRRHLRMELGLERTRLLETYSVDGASLDLGHDLLNAVQALLVSRAAVRTSWQLFSHQYDNCLLFLTDGERAEMEAVFVDITSCKTNIERKVKKITSELHDWMPCFSIVLPEAAFQRCLSTLSWSRSSQRELKRLIRPLVHDLTRLSVENTSLLHEDTMSFRELLGDFNALRPGDLTVAESCGPAQLFLRQRDTVLGSLEQQSRTAMTIQGLLRAEYLYPFAIPNVDGTLVPVDRLRQAFEHYGSIRTKCERILEACASLRRKIHINKDLLTALSPIEFRIRLEENVPSTTRFEG